MIERDEAIIAAWDARELAVRPARRAYEAARDCIEEVCAHAVQHAEQARDEALAPLYRAYVAETKLAEDVYEAALADIGAPASEAMVVIWQREARQAAERFASQ